MSMYDSVYSAMGLPTPQPGYNSTLGQIYNNMGIAQPGLAIKGGQKIPLADVVAWVNQHSPSELLRAMQQYNVNPIDLLNAYNAGAGTNISNSDAVRYLRSGGSPARPVSGVRARTRPPGVGGGIPRSIY